jgi:hypothetical protein
MTGISDLRAAIGRVLLSVDGIVGTLGNYSNPDVPIEPDAIPGFFIDRKSRGLHEWPSRDEVQSTREFFVVVVVAQIDDSNVPESKETAYAALEPFLDAIPLAFGRERGLSDENGDALPDVVGITRLVDDVPEEITRERKRYTAIPYRISVTINRSQDG